MRYRRPVVLFGDLERARDLPPEVATAKTVDEAVAFVQRHLARSAAAAERGGGFGPAPE